MLVLQMFLSVNHVVSDADSLGLYRTHIETIHYRTLAHVKCAYIYGTGKHMDSLYIAYTCNCTLVV